jgi:sporulation protein YlmC with PRC-barrel domain
MLNVDEILKHRVVEVTRGSDIGRVSGVLIDVRERRIAALAVSTGGAFGGTVYVPWGSIRSIEKDVIAIPSSQSVLRRRNFPAQGVIESLSGRRILTDDGMELGIVRNFSIDLKTGDIAALTFSRHTGVLGGLFGTGKEYTVPATLIETLDESIIVDKSVPDIVGYERAA